jgi:hypothetical protein
VSARIVMALPRPTRCCGVNIVMKKLKGKGYLCRCGKTHYYRKK